ncbi:hypothetical protein [Fontibacillus sp. BL9]|uniref:hypothetical protein n=1 Tax=Fontibacillus sp. BL9 TaxID=3389971 RepID=UPI00397854F8
MNADYMMELSNGSLNYLKEAYPSSAITTLPLIALASSHNAVSEGMAVTVGLDYSFIHSQKGNMVTIDLEASEASPIYYGWVTAGSKYVSPVSERLIHRLQFGFSP